MIEYLRIYLGYAAGYLTFKLSLSTLNTLFEIIDKIVETDQNQKNNTNQLKRGSEIRNIGGGDLVPIKKHKLAIEKFRSQKDRLLTLLLKPVGTLIKNIPLVKKIYQAIKTLRITIASIVGAVTIRMFARFDYWGLVFANALPTITEEQKEILASISRMRMGIKDIPVCNEQITMVVNYLTDDGNMPIEKRKRLSDLFSFYERLSERHPFKNAYFVCLINLLLTLFWVNRLSFIFAIKILLRLLKEGKITMATYRQIISQLIIGGVSPIEIPSDLE